jgi:hypothetical protein
VRHCFAPKLHFHIIIDLLIRSFCVKNRIKRSTLPKPNPFIHRQYPLSYTQIILNCVMSFLVLKFGTKPSNEQLRESCVTFEEIDNKRPQGSYYCLWVECIRHLTLLPSCEQELSSYNSPSMFYWKLCFTLATKFYLISIKM